MSHARIEGWPELKVYEHYLPHEEMRNRCVKHTPALTPPEACMEALFSKGECHIYYSADFPPQQWIVDHERLHCLGHDHAGETTLRDALKRWRAAPYVR